MAIGTFLQAPPVDRKDIILEAENGRESSPDDTVNVYNVTSRFADHYIVSPNGTGDTNGSIRICTFNITESGYYDIAGLGYAATSKDNSFYIALDSSSYAKWDFQQNIGWYWDIYSSNYYFSAGNHTLFIKVREDGTCLNQILIVK